MSPSKLFSMIIVGFFIRKNLPTSDQFAQDLVHILDSSKSLVDYIHKVALAYRPSLVYSKNETKAAQPGGRFSILQLISLPIFRTTNVLEGDTRRDIDVTIADVEVVHKLSLNAFYMLMSNYKAK